MKKFIFFFLASFVIGSEQTFNINGYVSFAHISRLSNFSLIDIPYRMGSLEFEHGNKNFSLNGNFVLEYQVRGDTYFLGSKDPQEFRLDMREMYSSYSGNNFEFRIGKQIHSWGSVDENSPLDNASAFDYYYIFFPGTERKMATMSAALDYYYRNLKTSIVFSPLHHTSRIPLGDDDFPITLPIYPDKNQIFPINKLPFEGGIYTTLSHEKGDVSFSYYSTYDRVFNLTGINVYGHGSDLSFPHIDILFSYRKTNVVGLGSVFLTDWFILRGDIGYFSTRDHNSSIRRESSNNPTWYDSLHFSYPLKEQADFYETALQIETELPMKINLIAQYFQYDTIFYSSQNLPIDQEISIPNLNIDPEDITPSFFFNPGIGSPMAVIANKAAIIMLNKYFIDDQMKISASSMIDLESYAGVTGIPGSLIEFKIEYNINQDLLGLLSLTKINGADNHPNGSSYRFNMMEDFSHIRFEIKYYF